MASGWKKDYFRYKGFFLNILSIYNTKPSLKIYLELILSLVTVVMFSVFAIKPTILTIIELTKEINAKTELSTQLKQKVANLKTASNILQQNFEDIQLIYTATPKKSLPEIFIKQIEQMSNESSLKILNISLTDVTILGKDTKKPVKGVEPIASGSNEISFTFSATGTYQDIVSFTKKMENLKRPVKFDLFQINSSNTEEQKVIILTVAGRIPFLEE